MIKILLTGGGSGGHIFPLVAVSSEIKKIAAQNNSEVEISYLGASGDFRVILENFGIQVYAVLGGKIRNYFSVLNFFDFFLVPLSFFQALLRMLILMPDALFSKGGPGAFPVVLAASFYRIPIIIHDSDAIPGRTNKLSAFFAKRIAVSFPGTAKYIKGNLALTGNPVRGELLFDLPSREAAFQKLKFDPTVPLVLVLGSSQGATRINDFIFNNLGELVKDFQILHQVGRFNYTEAMAQREFLVGGLPESLRARYQVSPFLEDDYKLVLYAADVVVGRASSGTIFEIAAFGKPSILIPLPESAQNHQRENAYAYAETGACFVIEQENLLPTIFMEQVKKILENKELAQKMSEAAKSFSRPDAAKVIAEEVLRLASKR